MFNLCKYFLLLNLLAMAQADFAADAAAPLPPAPAAAAPEPATSAVPAFAVTLNGREELVQTESLDNPLIVMSTNHGDMLLELFEDEAPQTVANFLGLAHGTKPFTDPATGQQVTRPF